MTAAPPHEAGFSITVEPSGRHFTVHGDETILAAGIRQGIGLPYGCKDGACGSCKCKKLSGEVTLGPHQSKALSAEEQLAGYVLTCCAHATSDVVLESRQVTEAGALPIRKMPVRVLALTRQSHDVMMLRLQLLAHPSVHIEVFGPAAAPVERGGPLDALEFHVLQQRLDRREAGP